MHTELRLFILTKFYVKSKFCSVNVVVFSGMPFIILNSNFVETNFYKNNNSCLSLFFSYLISFT